MVPAVITRKFHMQYLLLLYASSGFTQMSAAEQEQAIGAYAAFNEALRQAGVLNNSNRLRPASTATTVRVNAAGKTEVLNGPFADSKEELGGYFIIDVPDLDAALAWAARCPGARHGAVEVRPIWPRGA
jgi:hypothetical protein